MSQERDAYDGMMRAALKNSDAGDISLTTDVWPFVRLRIVKETRADIRRSAEARVTTLRKGIAGGIAVVLILVSTLAVASAASPEMRNMLHRVAQQVGLVPASSSVSVTGAGRFHDLQPLPSFNVFYLKRVPSTLPVWQVGQLRHSNGGPADVVPSMGFFNCPQTIPACLHAVKPPSGVCDAACQQIRHPFLKFRYPPDVESEYQRGIATVWFWYSAAPPAPKYLHIVERPANSGIALPVGESITVAGNPATLQQTGYVTTIRFVRSGTAVTLTTTLGRTTALNAAASLLAR